MKRRPPGTALAVGAAVVFGAAVPAVVLAYRAHILAATRTRAVSTAPMIPVTPPRVEPPRLTPPKRKEESATARSFHGMYPCTIGSPCPSYSASFLTSKEQLLSNPVTDFHMERPNTNMETASYHAMGHRNRYDVWRTVDALDFTVEHLSMYERMLHSQTMKKGARSKIAEAVYAVFLERLRRYESHLRRTCPSGQSSSFGGRTVGVMPFYAAGGAGSGHTRRESKALYLNITIRSIRCHFGAIAVSCLHPGDKAYLEAGIGLPEIDAVLWIDPDGLKVQKPSFLGVATVRELQQRFANKTSSFARQFDFIFYTEADQVLHIRQRHRDKLFRPFLQPQKRLAVLTPHRLNAVPRVQDYTEVRAAFASNSIEARAVRRNRFPTTQDDYDPTTDVWHANMFAETIKKGGWVKRELDGYGAKKLTRFHSDLTDGSCCYLSKNENAYPYDVRGKKGGVRLDDSLAGDFGELEDRPSPVELIAFGDHGLAVLAGLCCQICARRGKLGRHCDNFCTPARDGSDCAIGSFADDH